MTYEFLNTNERLRNNISLLTYGGSHAYGTNIEDSDIDIRGIYLNTPKHILGVFKTDPEQYIDNETDTCIYSMEKAFKLLSECNPNIIEILGCRESDYFILDDIGRLLIDNRELFLSKRAYYTFGSYAQSQLTKLENYLCKKDTDPETQRKQLESILNRRMIDLESKFRGKVKLGYYIEDGEIKLNIEVNDVEPSLASQVFNELITLIKGYKELGSRNTKKTDKAISKHIMHLYRLYFMCIDILEKHEINTYREKEHDFLMAIRNGEMQLHSGELKAEAIEILEKFKINTQRAFESTTLPSKVDTDKLNELYIEIVTKTLQRKDDNKAHRGE